MSLQLKQFTKNTINNILYTSVYSFYSGKRTFVQTNKIQPSFNSKLLYTGKSHNIGNDSVSQKSFYHQKTLAEENSVITNYIYYFNKFLSNYLLFF